MIGLTGPQRPALDAKVAKATVRKIDPVVKAAAEAVADEAKKTNILNASAKLLATGDQTALPLAWATAFTEAAKLLRTRFGEAAIVMDDAVDEPLAELEDVALGISSFDTRMGEARKLVATWIPTFLFTPGFPELYGHQNLDQFLNQRGQNHSLIEAENNFEKLAKVADFNPAHLNANRDNHELRNQTVNRASSLVTQAVQRLWKDRSLTVRFNLDGPHLDILVSDPTSSYPVEVNLDERSRGFRWFFSFYITFAADTHGGNADGAI